MRFNIGDTEMTADQEFLFQQKTRERTGKFFWAAVFFVLLFQIYNISYTLYYTHFRLGSRASKIYMCMYVGMLLVCAAAILIGALAPSMKSLPGCSVFMQCSASFCCSGRPA